MLQLSKIIPVAAVSLAVAVSGKACPPLGPVLPAPTTPSKNDIVSKAMKGLTSIIDEKTADINSSAISIGVKSIHEDEQLFKYHFSPPVHSGIGTEKIDEDTIYRVGSVSKMMPALLAVQMKEVDLNACVLEYLPELRNATSPDGLYATSWEDITVGSIATYMSGLATDTASDLAAFPSDQWAKMGLPEVPKGTGPTCSGYPGTEPCTDKDLIHELSSRPPVFQPDVSPSYSNVGYAILAMVIEAATGEKISDLAKKHIWDVAGMDSTSFNGPVKDFSRRGYVSPQEITWNLTLGVYEPTGGMFSSTNDLIAFGQAILKNDFLSALKTREWMKPHGHTSSLGIDVGVGWEILRSSNITSDGRLIDIYSKSGDLGLYHAMVAVVPDYDISIAVLTGGLEVSADASVRDVIFSAVIKALVPALDEAARDQASRFEGTYTDKSSNSTLIISKDKGPGLLVEKFQVGGFDAKDNFGSYSIDSAPSDEVPDVEGRLYPTTRKSKRRDGSTETAWRAIYDSTTEKDKEMLNNELFIFDGSCTTWFQIDRASYNLLSLAEFSMVENARGDITAVKNKAFNVTLTKVSGSGSGNGDGSGNAGGDKGDVGDVPKSSAQNVRAMGSMVPLLGTLLILYLSL